MVLLLLSLLLPLGSAEGILVKSTATAREVSALLPGFKSGRVFSQHKVYEFIPSQKQTETKLLETCASLKKNPHIEFCELDRPLAPEPLPERQPSANVQPVDQGECKLVLPEPNYRPRTFGLTPHWAQEYTGADLLRNLLKSKPNDWKVDPKEIDILEAANESEHSDVVAHLIMGPASSAAIPSAYSLSPTNIRNISDIFAYTNGLMQARHFPRYINNSTTWGKPYEGVDSVIYNVRATQPFGTLWIVASGNGPGKTERSKSAAARELNVLLIGNMGPRGVPYNTLKGEELLISAPAGNEMLSFNNQGEPLMFSGTSAAAPQVTSALLAFDAITNYHLNKAEASQLLKRTSIKYNPMFTAEYGAGTLNTYKIGRLAFRLKEKCRQDQSCIKTALGDAQPYNFTIDNLAEIKSAFAQCFGGSKESNVSCIDRRRYLAQLRAAALLNPKDMTLWRGLGCVYQKIGFVVNAEYYNSVPVDQ